jgi:hypothetical protein
VTRTDAGRDRAADSAVAAALDAYITAAAALLALPIAPEWRPAIRENLAAMLQLAAPMLQFPLPDDAEPAPVFRP